MNFNNDANDIKPVELGANCNDPIFQQNCVSIHMITNQTYDSGVCAFFGTPTPPAPKSYSSTMVPLPSILPAVCTKYILITYNELNLLDNNDINVSIANQPYPPAQVNQAFYSIALFKGIMAGYNPDTINFSKATVGIKKTVIMQALVNGSVVLSVNLSDSVPM